MFLQPLPWQSNFWLQSPLCRLPFPLAAPCQPICILLAHLVHFQGLGFSPTWFIHPSIWWVATRRTPQARDPIETNVPQGDLPSGMSFPPRLQEVVHLSGCSWNTGMFLLTSTFSCYLRSSTETGGLAYFYPVWCYPLQEVNPMLRGSC